MKNYPAAAVNLSAHAGRWTRNQALHQLWRVSQTPRRLAALVRLTLFWLLTAVITLLLVLTAALHELSRAVIPREHARLVQWLDDF